MEFFAPYKQKKIYIRNHAAKSPLFYKSLNMMGAVFTVNLEKVTHLLPKTLNLIPLTLAPLAKQRAIIGIYCFEYKETDIGPYNEFSIALALNPTGTNFLSFLSAFEIIKNIFTESHHGYVLQMPVTTELAYWGGVDYFNFPKYITNIQFEDTLTTRICNVYDRSNQKLIFSFEGEKISIK
ncbi:MAG: acetoacetate decarboxylase family protein, partial [Deltaproteobacteria bacterium]|nr:acetoacetate decarboxylase family protein [Deltaproteobacteria bacterium]